MAMLTHTQGTQKYFRGLTHVFNEVADDGVVEILDVGPLDVLFSERQIPRVSARSSSVSLPLELLIKPLSTSHQTKHPLTQLRRLTGRTLILSGWRVSQLSHIN